MQATPLQLSRGRQKDGSPNNIDIYVGKQMRLRRQMLNISQEKLAEMLGVTFQQVQKYEKGITRIGASRLYFIAQKLGTEMNYFFPLLNSQIKDPMKDPKITKLALYFKKIKDPQVAKSILELLKNITVS
ncbi:MAG: helix-turn-helix transcriptional regulator [Alphaproteobacteria bacterium]